MINFYLGERYEKDGMSNASRFTFSLRKFVIPEFCSSPSIQYFKGVDHCLK